MKLVKNTNNKLNENKQISDKDAEEAFKTILTWMGEDPNREGLLETPKRVIKAFIEYFNGYKEDPVKIIETRDTLVKEGKAEALKELSNKLDNIEQKAYEVYEKVKKKKKDKKKKKNN